MRAESEPTLKIKERRLVRQVFQVHKSIKVGRWLGVTLESVPAWVFGTKVFREILLNIF